MGGVYLDTDVVAVRNIEDLLNDRAFIGFENKEFISAAVMGAEKEHPLIKKMLDKYNSVEKKEFGFEDNNSLLVTDILKNEYKLQLNNAEQYLDDDRILSNPSGNSKTIHVFTGTWLERR